jgi:CRISPR/Cas system-associated protein Csm6
MFLRNLADINFYVNGKIGRKSAKFDRYVATHDALEDFKSQIANFNVYNTKTHQHGLVKQII